MPTSKFVLPVRIPASGEAAEAGRISLCLYGQSPDRKKLQFNCGGFRSSAHAPMSEAAAQAPMFEAAACAPMFEAAARAPMFEAAARAPMSGGTRGWFWRERGGALLGAYLGKAPIE